MGRVHTESILLHHPPEAAAASPVLCVKTAHFHPWSFSQTPSLHPPFGKQQIGLDKTWNCCCDWGVPLVGPGTGFYGSKAVRRTADGSCSLCRAVNRGSFSFSPSPLMGKLSWNGDQVDLNVNTCWFKWRPFVSLRWGAFKEQEERDCSPVLLHSFVHIFQLEEPDFQFALPFYVHIFMSVLMKNAAGLVTQHGW